MARGGLQKKADFFRDWAHLIIINFINECKIRINNRREDVAVKYFFLRKYIRKKKRERKEAEGERAALCGKENNERC